MNLYRRQMLALLPCLLAPSPLLAARPPKRQPAALLVPLSGPHAALGRSMQRAAMLAQNDLIAFDTAGTPEGAAAAATEALRQGARIILGPVFAADVRPVLAAVAGRVPVLAFSNDPALADSGAFLLGITPSQTTSAILQYARSRGIRRIAAMAGDSPWARQSIAVATGLQGSLGIEVREIATMAALGADTPDALLLPDTNAASDDALRIARELGIQPLGTLQSVDYVPAALAAAEGGWFAAPDPAGFTDFAREYAARHGGAPGAIAAIAYDGGKVVEALRRATVDRASLLAATSFPGVAGTMRFRSNGSCQRELAILVADAQGYTTVGRSLSV